MPNGKEHLTILVVDDEALVRWSLAEVFRRSGHTVIEATSAREALDAISPSSSVDAVLLDDRLPDSADFQLLEQIRRRLPRSPVVLMTAFDTPDVVQAALDLGASRVLTKPFDMYGVEGLITEASGASRYYCDREWSAPTRLGRRPRSPSPSR
jgi:two-component system nitrogen regulation response regulator GlnG